MFRELKRKNKALSKEDCIEILTTETRGILSVNGDDGYPYSMPMNHFYNEADGCIYFHSGKGGHRSESLIKDDKVCFCVCEKGERLEGDWAYTVRSVIVFGKMEIIDDMDVIEAIADKLCRKFTNDEEYIKREISAFAKETLILKLTPEHICGKRVKES